MVHAGGIDVKNWFIGVLVYLGAALNAYAQESLWRLQTSDDRTVTATIAMDHPTSGATIVTLLNVGFSPKTKCQAEVGIAMLKGSSYGNPVGRMSPPRTEPVSLMVDQTRVATPAPFLVKYDNGLEAVFPADQRIIQALIAGITATVQIVSGTPKFEFPIAGAGAIIAKAQRQCMSNQ